MYPSRGRSAPLPIHASGLLAALLLAACSELPRAATQAPDPAPTPTPIATAGNAVVATRAADFSSGAHALVDLDTLAVEQNLAPVGSDLSVRAAGGHFYRVGRLFAGNAANIIARFSPDAPELPQYTYSTQDAAKPDEGSNPYDIVEVAPDKAYVLRYGAGSLWVVNPQAQSEGGFLQAEIDLSAFDGDGVPEMAAATVAAGRAYVLLQRLQFFDATQDSQLVAIDIASDTLVDLDPDAPGVNSIELPARNASEIVVAEGGDALYVLAVGGRDFNDDFTAFTPRYDGALLRVDLADHGVTTVLDDGTPQNAPYGQFADMAQTADGTLWLVAGDPNAGGSNSLYRVDAQAGTASAEGLPAQSQNTEITAANGGPRGALWLGLNAAQPGLLRVDGDTLSTRFLPLELVPLNIDFVSAD